MQALKRILCPVDFSATSNDAARYALELAGALGAELELLHVHHVPLHESDANAPKSVDDLAPELRKHLLAQLQGCKQALGPAAANVRTTLVVGVPYIAIDEAARRSNADLIVMGTTGRTGLARVLLGSVTERVLRLADRPVLTVRSGA